MKNIKYLIRLIILTYRQYELRKKNVSIMVTHYPSGSYSFEVSVFPDAAGWKKVSPFMAKKYYTYADALSDGLKWYKKYLKEL